MFFVCLFSFKANVKFCKEQAVILQVLEVKLWVQAKEFSMIKV